MTYPCQQRTDQPNPVGPPAHRPNVAEHRAKDAGESSGNQCTDLANAMTCYPVLAVLPTAIASMCPSGFRQGPKPGDTLLQIISHASGSLVARTVQANLGPLSKIRARWNLR